MQVIELSKVLKEVTPTGVFWVTAESCTGGGLAYAITETPGSSRYFERGFVTYSNLAKTQQLGVCSEILEASGAVSEETAEAMAQGALAHSEADYAISVTGIAGPDSDGTAKPVGAVYFGLTNKKGESRVIKKQFDGDRAAIRRQSILFGLQAMIDFASVG